MPPGQFPLVRHRLLEPSSWSAARPWVCALHGPVRTWAGKVSHRPCGLGNQTSSLQPERLLVGSAGLFVHAIDRRDLIARILRDGDIGRDRAPAWSKSPGDTSEEIGLTLGIEMMNRQRETTRSNPANGNGSSRRPSRRSSPGNRLHANSIIFGLSSTSTSWEAGCLGRNRIVASPVPTPSSRIDVAVIILVASAARSCSS